jgi:hypothetical protein
MASLGSSPQVVRSRGRWSKDTGVSIAFLSCVLFACLVIESKLQIAIQNNFNRDSIYIILTRKPVEVRKSLHHLRSVCTVGLADRLSSAAVRHPVESELLARAGSDTVTGNGALSHSTIPIDALRNLRVVVLKKTTSITTE